MRSIRRLLAIVLISLCGCAMCQDCFDEYYASYGGRHPRANMVHGRVGSILDPAEGAPADVADFGPDPGPHGIMPRPNEDETTKPTDEDAPDAPAMIPEPEMNEEAPPEADGQADQELQLSAPWETDLSAPPTEIDPFPTR